MQSNHFLQPETVKRLCICVLSFLLLVPGFFSNFWNAAVQERFDSQQSGCQSLVIGRMIKSRRDGIFSAGGLNGAWVPDNSHTKGISDKWLSPLQASRQYSLYINETASDRYFPYFSQTGGQAMLFSLFDTLTPLSPRTKLMLLYLLTSMLSAAALTLIILWFHAELGLSAALVAVCSAALSHWLTVFGRDLWWSIWAFYLPMIAVMYFLKNKQSPTGRWFIRFGILCCIAVSIKCFINGYEYITTTLIMMLIPFIYYSIRDRRGLPFFLKGLLMAVLGSFLAVLLSITMLTFQIAAVKGNVQIGYEHILYSMEKRTYGDSPELAGEAVGSLISDTTRVLYTYLTGAFCDANNFITVSNPFISNYIFKIRYYYLLALFLLMSVIVCRRGISAQQRNTNIAFVFAAWVSMLAPLSWFIIFKGHSLVHTPLNFIVWQMPFTLFGFAVCGLALRSLFPNETAG